MQLLSRYGDREMGGKDGELLGVELRQVSKEVQKEPQAGRAQRTGQGRQGRAATVEEQTSSCWAWLTRCPRLRGEGEVELS